MFLVVDAPAAVPLFLSMSAGDSPERQRRTASRAAIAAGLVLASFGALGGAIFRLLGVSLGAFRIAGRVLLFLLAVDMLRAPRSRQRTAPAAFGLLRWAVKVVRALGRTGMNVLQRVMGLVLAATAVQFVVEGIGNVLPVIIRLSAGHPPPGACAPCW